jgi:uridine kinase
MKQIYLVVGTPGSGKTWVCNQLKDKYDYLPHDDFSNDLSYVSATARLADFSDKTVLIETPFSVTQIVQPLMLRGYVVTPVFIIEDEETTRNRYKSRENKDIPKGHLTRIQTYRDRAAELGAFSGTSEEVLAHLRTKV